MDRNKLEQLLSDVQSGEITVNQALKRLQSLPYENLEYARLDLHRDLRQGLPEVVFCENKTPDQVATILERLWDHHDQVLGTRVSPEIASYVLEKLPDAKYNSESKLLKLSRGDFNDPEEDSPYAMVVSGGTSDQPVAEEAAQTLEFLGNRV
ncbi:MAG: 1-(5-phosphoribosyl)-5-amino-4-imidazole-carboxylate carboxylase, partial [Anaerolineales bacterium]|nr:1-(5-phosphoribosyl)-5-amino-4-imidazole-carboxylate carboxylase [Anaerolineales bacterium]